MTDGMEAGTESTGRTPTRPGRSGRAAVLTVAVVALVLGGTALGVAADRSNPTVHSVVSCSSTTPKLTVQGTGQATVTPNLLTVVVNVNASGSSATAALASDNAKANAAVAALKYGGVAAKDIQTSGLNLQPQYAYPKGVPTLTGYQVSNTVTATLRNISKVRPKQAATRSSLVSLW